MGHTADRTLCRWDTSDFNHMCDCFIKGESVVSFDEFKNNSEGCLDQATPMLTMLSGVGPHEERYRWDRLQALHYLLLMFLNSYGYDFQYTTPGKIKKLVSRSSRPNKTVQNLNDMLKEISLSELKEVKNVLKAL